ncbi:MAG: glycoside hydrolase family 9 protein [Bacteroidales bacterium]
MKTFTKILGIFLLCCNVNTFVIAQDLTNGDYTKALWMTTRMYGGQRSGDGPNWLIMDHTPNSEDMSLLESSKGADVSKLQPGKCFTDDADGAHSLEGGWVDCGDHVKFGQTYFYAAYTLLKAYAEFPEGFDDFYSFDYTGYQSSDDFSWEGGKGEPNGIPDILDELKYQTDFLIQCAPNPTTFYSQVGNGAADHKNWVTSVAMATLPKSEGGQADGSRDFVKNPTDASMPSNCAATLALMARVYEPFDPAYAATCLTHAEYAYQYAKSNQGGTVAASSFYPANARWEDDYISACAELYWATGNEDYKNEALDTRGPSDNRNIDNHNYTYCYNNNDDVAAYNLALLGDSYGETLFEEFALMYKADVGSNDLYTGGDGTWGPLRYNANAAFIVGLWQKYNNDTIVDKFIYDQVDYILGSNTANFSFVVGFNREGCGSCNSAQHPHHRNVFLSDNIMAEQDTLVIPTRNAQHGYMIGGSRDPNFTEDIGNYETSEGGIDYNAGLVAALGYIISMDNPVDINQFGHPTPELGDELTLCGTGEATITATTDLSSLQSGESITYKWYKGSSSTPFNEGANLTSVTVTEADTYTCEIAETSGAWTTSDDIVVSAELPTVDLGADAELCEETTKTLDAGVSGTGINYAWSIDGSVIPDATAQTYTAYNAGTYSVTVSAAGCTDKTDDIIITSLLPEVQHDTICEAGTVNLAVSTPGTYEWYDSQTGGTPLETETTYSTTISESTTFYVQDASSFDGTAGASTTVGSSTNDWGVSDDLHMAFTVGSDFTVHSMKLFVGSVYGDGSGTVTVEILDGNGNAFSPAKTFTSDPINIETGMAGSLVEFSFGNFTVEKAWGENLRIRLSSVDFNGSLSFHNSGASYPYESSPSGIVTLTGAYQGTTSNSNYYLYFYDWQISAGSTCGRTPVLGIIDPNADCGDTQAPTTPGTISFSDITLDSFSVSWGASTDNVEVTEYEVYLDGTLYETVSGTSTSTTVSGLDCNTEYAIKVRAKDAAGNSSDFNTESITSTEYLNAPIVSSPVKYTVGETATQLTAENITGSSLLWYTSPTGTGNPTAPEPSTTSEDTTSYFVTQTLSGCESPQAQIDVIVTSDVISQTIPLQTGWNLISIQLEPINASIDTLFADIMNNVDLIKNADGFYKPGQALSLQSLQTFELGKAYLVKMNTASDLIISGTQVESGSISLQAGWNMFSHPQSDSTSGSIENTLYPLINDVIILKDFNEFYDANDNTGTLDEVLPGKGYYLYLNSENTFSW